MNTDKTINEKFAKRTKYPIWYYKELKEIDVDDVICYLLNETFVVDIEGSKHEIIFGYNEKENYVGKYISHDDIKHSHLTSSKVINNGFKVGKWFIVSDIDTSDEFKENYRKRKEECDKKELEQFYRNGLSNIVKSKDLDVKDRDKFLKQIDECTFEQLEELMKSCFGKKRIIITIAVLNDFK